MTRTRTMNFDRRVGVLGGLLALTLLFSLEVVPRATAPTAPDALLGAAQLTWWALWNVVALLLLHLVLRPPRG
jgi:hypothetical protein